MYHNDLTIIRKNEIIKTNFLFHGQISATYKRMYIAKAAIFAAQDDYTSFESENRTLTLAGHFIYSFINI